MLLMWQARNFKRVASKLLFLEVLTGCVARRDRKVVAIAHLPFGDIKLNRRSSPLLEAAVIAVVAAVFVQSGMDKVGSPSTVISV